VRDALARGQGGFAQAGPVPDASTTTRPGRQARKRRQRVRGGGSRSALDAARRGRPGRRRTRRKRPLARRPSGGFRRAKVRAPSSTPCEFVHNPLRAGAESSWRPVAQASGQAT